MGTKNYYGASTSSVDDSLYVILFFRKGRIDLERFFLVENFQRRGERKFALRRVERKRERERRGILISFRREKKATFSESVLLFFLYGPLFVRALNVRKEGEKKVLLFARERRIGTLISAPPQSSVLCPLKALG